jgi:hypothetical protein
LGLLPVRASSLCLPSVSRASQPEFGALTVLHWFSLSGNQLSSVPGDYLRNLRKLEHLNLSSNKLGSLPENLPLLVALNTLDGKWVVVLSGWWWWCAQPLAFSSGPQ